jgi:hypothetical protein
MNKRFLLVLTAVLVLFAFGIAGAAQIDGLRSGKSNADGGGMRLPEGLENFVNPGGLGDALIYNYYNARNNMVTYFSVVNTGVNSGNVVRLRFYEGADVCGAETECPTECRGSYEVLDFDICLSPGDMFSGWVEVNPITGGAQLCSIDDDTAIIDQDGTPRIPHPFAPPLGVACKQFKFGAQNTISQITAANTLEGYFAIFGEHQADTTSNTTCFERLSDDVNNVLTGNVVMIDDTNSFAYTATAIADFADGDIGFSLASGKPDFDSGTNGLAGVNYILTKSDLISVYDIGGLGATEYVMTLPTKRLSQLCGAGNDKFDDKGVHLIAWDDEENTSEKQLCTDSPCPPGTTNELPYEVNVLRIRHAASLSPFLLDSLLVTTVDPFSATTPTLPFDFGWFRTDFAGDISSGTFPSHNTVMGAQQANGWPILGLSFMRPDDTSTGVHGTVTPMQYKNEFSRVAP